ncbi:ACT domain-containing protein [Nocardioides mangrovicus]|uniref:ACT domain-containing protein n=1 Tax=Nocardioides mangrovicus TaxID=2478913 RepID=A0A3L8NZ98_9ACTN|nr:ACT domain-containing protein [Nocardioides mangrovicus]RLV47987.1 ACT domain-containing protein [Nocardioides mangrovicus]
MSFLLRVALPDVPGSLGRLASAIGAAGGNIDAIEIVEHRGDGCAVDDVFLTLAPSVMPDSIVSACHQLDGVRVQWISRYTAGGNLFLDLEVVESMTQQPDRALDLLLDALPAAFRVDWAAQLTRTGDRVDIVRRTPAAPERVPGDLGWPEDLGRGLRLPVPEEWGDVLAAGCSLAKDTVVIARRGGPEILDSEIARLRHLCALADSIARN